jgi:microcystin-dependent protein
MAIDFPNSPTDGQSFTAGNTKWIYSAAAGKWNIAAPETPSTTAFAPIGTVINYMGASPPNGWILCNGASLSRSTYANLFAVLGTVFGQGSNPGSTFALPNFIGTTGIYIIRATDDNVTVSSAANLLAMPVGTMSLFAMTTVPAGWVRCDGQALSRTGYADLFSAISTTYGTGDGSTTFNVPNVAGSGTGSPLYYIKAILSGDAQPATVAHATSHIRTGTDIIDGDRLQVDYVPSRYTRDSSASEAGATTDLTAHLKGLDNHFERVRIDASGRITLPYQPAFHAYLNTSGNPASASPVVYTQTRFNIGSHYSTATGRFTAPVAGVYFFAASVNMYGSNSTGSCNVNIYNAAGVAQGRIAGGRTLAGITGDANWTVAGLWYMAATDYARVEITAYGTHSGGPDYNQFQGALFS